MYSYLTESVVPLFGKLSPVQAVLVTLFFGFGGVMLVRILLERKVYLLRWMTFIVGDSIGFTWYAYFASKGLQDFQPTGAWYTQRWVIGVFAALGLCVGLFLLRDAMTKRQVTWKDACAPSELFHTFLSWPVLAALIGSSLLPLYLSGDSSANKWLAMMGLVIYALTFVYDSSPLQDSSRPGR